MKLYKVYTGYNDGDMYIYYLVKAESPELANIKAREVANSNPHNSFPFYDPILAYIEEVRV
jgi:hypothetical protein